MNNADISRRKGRNLFRNLKKSGTIITFLVILTYFSLAGCSSNFSQNQFSSSRPQSSTSADPQSVDEPIQQQQPNFLSQQPSPASRSDQQMFQSEFMTEIYTKMAEELNISTNDIAETITQAETERGK